MRLWLGLKMKKLELKLKLKLKRGVPSGREGVEVEVEERSLFGTRRS